MNNHLESATESDTLMRAPTSAHPINNIKNTWHIKWGTINLLRACLPPNCARSEVCHSCAIIILSKLLQVPCALLPRAMLIKKASQILTSTTQHCLWHLKKAPIISETFKWPYLRGSKCPNLPHVTIKLHHTIEVWYVDLSQSGRQMVQLAGLLISCMRALWFLFLYYWQVLSGITKMSETISKRIRNSPTMHLCKMESLEYNQIRYI